MSSFSQFRRRVLRALRQDDTGATAVEYGLLVALIATAIFTAVLAVGGQLSTVFTNFHQLNI